MTCIFCQIAAGEIPTPILARSTGAVAFRDLSPKAPIHVLIVPVGHYSSAAAIPEAERAAVMGEVLALAVQTAEEMGIASSGYRLVVNTGRDGGQSVDHLHVHLLAGRQMAWPPG